MSVALRAITSEDGARILRWRNSPDVSAYMYTDQVIAPDEHARWLATAMSAPDRRYWIIEDDGAPVGLANIVGIDRVRQHCDWAYYLGEASVRGRGVGAAVEFIVIDHVFAALHLHKLWCEVLLENETVWRLHESFGFVREALFRDHVFKAGRFQDVVGLGLLADDWARVRAGCAERLKQKGYGPGDLVMRDQARV
jgi:UDP-4-amino-4,6-dideoxy-N-acetyl-beta-L-altrosamine N-acetyltransferase